MLNKLPYQMPSVEELLEQFHLCRKYSTDLISNLSAEDCQAQSMEDASPAEWHLAHDTWFYEAMVLKPFEENFSYWNPQFAVLFNSYYNGVGNKYPRSKRGLLTRPSLAEVLEWRKNIEDRVTKLLKVNSSLELLWLIQLGINHEQQHQELLLTDIYHLFSNNSLYPAHFTQNKRISYAEELFQWHEGVNGLVETDHDGNGLQFIEDSEYQNFKWWLDSGWAWLQTEKMTTQFHWNKEEQSQPLHFSLNGNTSLELHTPVSKISYFKADAFTRRASQSLVC
jgi:hypothetical protein